MTTDQRQRLRVRPDSDGNPPGPGECVWGYDEEMASWGWIEVELLDRIYEPATPGTLPTLCEKQHEHDEDCDEDWWWVEASHGARYAVENIEIAYWEDNY